MSRTTSSRRIVVKFKGDSYTKYGFFPLLAWYMMEILALPSYFTTLTVKKKRNRKNPIKRRRPQYDTSQMCVGIISIILLGIPNLRKINDILSTETKIANLIGLRKFFDQSTAHLFLNEFHKWHVDQLDRINEELLIHHGEAIHQDPLVIDIDATTHSLESRKREKAVAGYNRKNRGKPCYQWTVAFVKGEAVYQKLSSGNTSCKIPFESTICKVKEKLGEKEIAIVRVDGGYVSGKHLAFATEKSIQIVTTVPYKWIVAQGIDLKEHKWIPYDKDTAIYDLGEIVPFSTAPCPYRTILIKKKQHPFPNKKEKKVKIIHYGIIENLKVRLSSQDLFRFYQQRQTIENFFKESKQSFSSGRMPSQRFRGNEAYLQLVTTACNCFQWFKKNFCHQSGPISLWTGFELK